MDQAREDVAARRIGAEQEMFLIDSAGRPVPLALPILEKLGGASPQFTLELAQFTLETNLMPRPLGGDCFSEMEKELRANLEQVLEAARSFGANILLTGILPSLRLEDLSLDSMCPIPRYRALNDAITSPLPTSGLPIRVTAVPIRGTAPNATIAIAVEVETGGLQFVERDGQLANRIYTSYVVTDEDARGLAEFGI